MYLSIYLSIYQLFASITIIDDSCKLEIGQRSMYIYKNKNKKEVINNIIN